MNPRRCRYCGVDDGSLRFERSYRGESNYVCRSVDSCVARIKRFSKKKQSAAGHGAQGDPATAGLSVRKRSGVDLPPHATARGLSFTNEEMRNLLKMGL